MMVVINIFLTKNDTLAKAVIPLPIEALEFVVLFDDPIQEKGIDIDLRNEMVMEFRENMSERSFEIDVPDEIIDHIGIDQVYKILSESETLQYIIV